VRASVQAKEGAVWFRLGLQNLTLCAAVFAGAVLAGRGSAADIDAYRRSDQVNAVVYVGAAGQVEEISLKPGSNWSLGTLPSGAHPATGTPSGYFRWDQVNSVVYRGANDNHIHELYLRPHAPAWGQGDLSSLSGAPPAAGNPTGYLRWDGVDAVVYRGADGHIHEIALGSGPKAHWVAGDLFVAAKPPYTPEPAASDPSACECWEGNVVVYLGADLQVYSLVLKTGSGWRLDDLTSIVQPPVIAAGGRPFAYMRDDVATAVVYLGADSHIYELSLADQGSTWAVRDLTTAAHAPLAVGDPMGYVRSDGDTVVVFRGALDNHIYELALPWQSSWRVGDLTKVTGAPVAAGDPFGYVRTDGINAVVYRTADGKIHELSLGYGPGAKWEPGVLP
jgi:hypothetical protein